MWIYKYESLKKELVGALQFFTQHVSFSRKETNGSTVVLRIDFTSNETLFIEI